MAIRKSDLQQKIGRTGANPAVPASDPSVSSIPSREQEVELAAYYRAQARGFAPGLELDDWLAAERELLESRSET